jgi:hypothetical protein
MQDRRSTEQTGLATRDHGNYADSLRCVRICVVALRLANIGTRLLRDDPLQLHCAEVWHQGRSLVQPDTKTVPCGMGVGRWCVFQNIVRARSADATTGNYGHTFSTKAFIAGPFLAVFGAECTFQSTILTLTSALTQEYVQR